MATFRVRVTRLVGMAYRDFVRVLVTMPGFVATALAIAAGCGLVEFFVAANLQEVPWVGASLRFAISVVESFLFTPILIAVHRLIILDEVTPRYVIDPNDRRLLRFFVWSLAVTAFTSVPLLLEGVVPRTVPLGFRLALGLAILIIVITVTMRLTILFPAIAVDARGANVANVLADTKGHGFQILLVFVLASLPLVVALFASTAAFPKGDPRTLLGTLVTSAIAAMTLPLFVALASRLFQALADRVVRPITADGAAT